MSTNPSFLYNKVDRLEEALIRLADAQTKTQAELSEFKEEMRFNLEKYEERSRRDLEAYREESRNEQRKLNQELGRISNKMGTIVEDLIYPATRPLISRYFSEDIENIDIYSNISKRNNKNERDEFDIIASTSDKVFLIEVKSTMKDSYIKYFKDKLTRFPDFFPEYKDMCLIPIMASLTMLPNTVHQLTKNNIYAMAYREWDYMDILNFDSDLGK
ncbi:MAG: hypothetical protein EVJ46_07335 [Candidatus Acididesulfobacter guangdongensis]|uniref:DUF3782 domain-containing protein n=1 Tax=Acididesulfobacter guangdongensis TaxID=2597225 RepID=A0A519BFF6_ACIG2|nr:MAG: hypothetical protein EVJ46_07335 [Candidatus Acididesulfobacter guangdongensis]